MSNEFISPMLAKPLPEDFDPTPGEWVVEEKLDGHRIVVHVDTRPADLFGGNLVRAWSRYGIERILPPHLREELQKLPNGVYDGELLVPGKRSYGTAALENSTELKYIVFDVLKLMGKDLTELGISASLDDRQKFLAEIFECQDQEDSVRLNASVPLENRKQIEESLRHVWARDGEGLILKRRSASYQPGKRPRGVWYKIKQLRTAVLTVVAFKEGKLGPNSIALLRDEQGCETQVKWKNYDELARIDADPASFIGRQLRIEFQERTPDGGYRHPRWDRWENE